MSIKINVGGTIFETTITTLKKINYFKYLLEDTNYDNTQIIFVDRPPHIFKHILALAIDENYNYPIKYKNELDFYDMLYDTSKFNNDIEYLKEQMEYLKKYMSVLDNRIGIVMYYVNNICKETDYENDFYHGNDEFKNMCAKGSCYKNEYFCKDHIEDNKKN